MIYSVLTLSLLLALCWIGWVITTVRLIMSEDLLREKNRMIDKMIADLERLVIDRELRLKELERND